MLGGTGAIALAVGTADAVGRLLTPFGFICDHHDVAFCRIDFSRVGSGSALWRT